MLKLEPNLLTIEYMYILAVSAYLVISFLKLDFLSYMSPFAYFLNNVCLDVTKSDAQHLDIYHAIICGKNLNYDLKNTQLLIEFSLIHWFVVSGSHFQSLKKYFSFFIQNKILVFLFLSFYLFITQIQDSALKAYFFYLLYGLNQTKKLKIPLIELNLISTVLCLCVNPQLISSLGLLLSTLCCAIALQGFSMITSTSLIFIAVLPIISNLNQPSVLSIPLNIALTPVISSVLFPMSLLGIFFKNFYYYLDQIFNLLFYFLKLLPQNNIPTVSTRVSIMPYWFYILTIHWTLSKYNSWKPKIRSLYIKIKMDLYDQIT